jgi:hypothetical protein
MTMTVATRFSVARVPELDVGGHYDGAVTLGEREDPGIGLSTKTFVAHVGGFETGGAK